MELNHTITDVPGLRVGVRLSAFDLLPFEADPLTGRGMPVARKDNRSYWFGCDEHDPLHYDLSETERLLRLLQGLGVVLVNLTVCEHDWFSKVKQWGDNSTKVIVQAQARFLGVIVPEDQRSGHYSVRDELRRRGLDRSLARSAIRQAQALNGRTR